MNHVPRISPTLYLWTPTVAESLVSQGVVTTMANFEANGNTGSGGGTREEVSQGDN